METKVHTLEHEKLLINKIVNLFRFNSDFNEKIIKKDIIKLLCRSSITPIKLFVELNRLSFYIDSIDVIKDIFYFIRNSSSQEVFLYFKALSFAKVYHGGQKYGDRPYLIHLINCAKIAKELNFNMDIILSCILHDIIEDTSCSYFKIKQQFGKKIADIINAVTDESGKTRKERKKKTYSKIILIDEAVIVKIIDRISNVKFSKLNSKEKLKMYMNEKDDFFISIIKPKINLPQVHKAYDYLLTEYN